MIQQTPMTVRTMQGAEGAGSYQVGGAEEEVYDDGCLRVEHNNYYATCRGERMQFTRAEFLLLSRLVRNPDRVVKSEELWQNVFGDARPYNADSLHVQMYRVRKRLSPFGISVTSMPNVGYSISLAGCCQG